MNTENITTFRLSDIMLESDLDPIEWWDGFKPSPITIGQRSHQQKQLLAENKEGNTFKLSLWNGKSQKIHEMKSKLNWRSSVHRL